MWDGIIFFDDDMYLPSLHHQLTELIMSLKEKALLCHVTIGLHLASIVVDPCCFSSLVLLLHESLHATIDNINVIFIDITGCEYLIVNGVFFGVPLGTLLISLFSSAYPL
jgi:hypothetical protein